MAGPSSGHSAGTHFSPMSRPQHDTKGGKTISKMVYKLSWSSQASFKLFLSCSSDSQYLRWETSHSPSQVLISPPPLPSSPFTSQYLLDGNASPHLCLRRSICFLPELQRWARALETWPVGSGAGRAIHTSWGVPSPTCHLNTLSLNKDLPLLKVPSHSERG